MILSYFSSRGWQSWDVEHRPVIPEGMSVLIDDDLLFEDGPEVPRPATVINRWLRLLPASGAPAPYYSVSQLFSRLLRGSPLESLPCWRMCYSGAQRVTECPAADASPGLT
jgi:hypothetical protein